MAATKVMVVRPWENQNDKEDEIEPETYISEEVAKIAIKELREENSTRTHCLHELRDWIIKNKDLENVRLDNNFLLRFLRVKKFSLPMAKIMILKYLNLRQKFPQYFYNLDYLEPNILELINRGYCFPSPVKDRNGRRVIIGIAANFDPHKYSSADHAKVHMVTYETLLEDEENQVLGFTHFGDCKTVSPAYVTIWNISDFATLVKWGEQSEPMRHKEVHLLNVPSPLKYVYDFAKSRMSPKMRERCTIHDSLADVHNVIDPSVLPKEYGGVIPMAEMIESWKRELAKKREMVIALDKMKLLDNSCLMNTKKSVGNTKEDIAIAGSFRKLEVD